MANFYRQSSVAAAGLLGLLLATSACGGSDTGNATPTAPVRSTAAFCNVVKEQSLKIRAKQSAALKNSESQTFSGELQAATTYAGTAGDTITMFKAMDKVAPADIEPDVATALEAQENALDSAGGTLSDPLSSLGGSLAAGLAAMGPEQNIENYINKNCDLSWMKDAK